MTKGQTTNLKKNQLNKKVKKNNIMQTLKDITQTDIKISSNKSARTFTIRKNGSKYRTGKFPYIEFAKAANFWTGNDWMNFLKQSNDYYIVK